MDLEIFDTLAKYLIAYPRSYLLHFSDDLLVGDASIDSIVVGCEGGMSEREIESFNGRIVGLDTPMILRSETAVCAVASKLLI